MWFTPQPRSTADGGGDNDLHAKLDRLLASSELTASSISAIVARLERVESVVPSSAFAAAPAPHEERHTRSDDLNRRFSSTVSMPLTSPASAPPPPGVLLQEPWSGCGSARQNRRYSASEPPPGAYRVDQDGETPAPGAAPGDAPGVAARRCRFAFDNVREAVAGRKQDGSIDGFHGSVAAMVAKARRIANDSSTDVGSSGGSGKKRADLAWALSDGEKARGSCRPKAGGPGGPLVKKRSTVARGQAPVQPPAYVQRV